MFNIVFKFIILIAKIYQSIFFIINIKIYNLYFIIIKMFYNEKKHQIFVISIIHKLFDHKEEIKFFVNNFRITYS